MPSTRGHPIGKPPGGPMRMLLTTIGLLFLCGCGGTGGALAAPVSGGTPLANCPIPAVKATPSWSGDIYPFIQASCGSASLSCHGGPGAAGRKDYSLGAAALHASLVGQAYTGISGWQYIKAGDPATSWLYEKVVPAVPGEPGKGATGSKIGSQMPLGGSLCSATTDTLRIWIQQGALNN